MERGDLNSDVLEILSVAAALVTVVAVPFGALVVYEKRTKQKPGSGRGVSSADSFSDITKSMG